MPRFLALPLLAGCFTPAVDPIDVSKVAYHTDYTSSEDIVLQPFEYTGLKCPDGSPANFFAIYQDDLDVPAPIVIVFHGGAFDYVYEQANGVVPGATDPDGEHYAGSEQNRLTSDWASQKIFETFGLLGEDLDEGEHNLGTLPAALADAGTFALYPGNCWGDLWHNEVGSANNDWDGDGGVQRNGRFLAWAMTAIASTDPDLATSWREKLGISDLTIPLDGSGVYLAGLAEGGRAAVELYERDVEGQLPTPVKGIILDSTMDNLYPLVVNDGAFRAYNDGLARIFPDVLDDDKDDEIAGDTLADGYRDDIIGDIGQFSLARYFTQNGVSVPTGVWYSSTDSLLPRDTMAGLEAINSPMLELHDLKVNQHVFVNNDETMAHDAVSYLLGL